MKITVYSQPDCFPCKGTMRDFDKLGIEYESIDVSEDHEALAFIKGLGYLQAPVVVVTGENGAMVNHWSGFRPDQIAALKP